MFVCVSVRVCVCVCMCACLYGCVCVSVLVCVCADRCRDCTRHFSNGCDIGNWPKWFCETGQGVPRQPFTMLFCIHRCLLYSAVLLRRPALQLLNVQHRVDMCSCC